MLYDNALLAELYLLAGEVLHRPDYTGVARETLNFMLRELATPEGAFVASLSAVDNNGVEGGYYLWQEPELKQILTDTEFRVIYLLWDMQTKTRFDAGFIPHQAVSPDAVAKQLGLEVGTVLTHIANTQLKLLKKRTLRALLVDTKRLASWNGLALSALSKAVSVPQQGEHFYRGARAVRDYLVTSLWNGKELNRAIAADAPLASASLEDYAYAAKGLYDWAFALEANQTRRFAITGESEINSGGKAGKTPSLVQDKATLAEQDMMLAKTWVEIAWRRYYSASGWLLSDKLLLAGSFGEPVVAEDPMPSPSSILIDISLKLARRFQDQTLEHKALDALRVG